MQQCVTFLVKATGNRHKIVRCLNSIARQNNPNYKIIAFLSVDNLKGRLKRDYPGIEIVKTADTAEFITKANAALRRLDTSHCMFVSHEEVVSPNAVDVILGENKDVLLCNISRKNTKNRFIPRFSADKTTDVLQHMKRGLLLWNAALNTELLRRGNLSLFSYTPAMQELFLLENIALADSVGVEQSVLVYKDTLSAKQTPTFEEFKTHRGRIKQLSKTFQKKGLLSLKQQLIMDFVVSQLSNYYEETGPLSKFRKRRLLKKYLVL